MLDNPNNNQHYSTSIADIKKQLLGDLPALLHKILPAGIIRGEKFYVGNVQGDKGESLVIELLGEKAGLWHDFATNDGGDIVDLYAQVKGFSRNSQFKELIQDLKRCTGSSSQKYNSNKLGKPTAKYDYTDQDGEKVWSISRKENPSGCSPCNMALIIFGDKNINLTIRKI